MLHHLLFESSWYVFVSFFFSAFVLNLICVASVLRSGLMYSSTVVVLGLGLGLGLGLELELEFEFEFELG